MKKKKKGSIEWVHLTKRSISKTKKKRTRKAGKKVEKRTRKKFAIRIKKHKIKLKGVKKQKKRLRSVKGEEGDLLSLVDVDMLVDELMKAKRDSVVEFYRTRCGLIGTKLDRAMRELEAARITGARELVRKKLIGLLPRSDVVAGGYGELLETAVKREEGYEDFVRRISEEEQKVEIGQDYADKVNKIKLYAEAGNAIGIVLYSSEGLLTKMTVSKMGVAHVLANILERRVGSMHAGEQVEIIGEDAETFLQELGQRRIMVEAGGRLKTERIEEGGRIIGIRIKMEHEAGSEDVKRALDIDKSEQKTSVSSEALPYSQANTNERE
ncbi:MAG: hypothetical protein QXP42_06020 [Candidatus Micrarchaeia archaeon]